MSSSNQGFSLGLDRPMPRPSARTSVVTAAPFAIAPEVAANPNGFQPMVFQPFDGRGRIVSLPAADEFVRGHAPAPVAELPEIAKAVEVVEPERPAPPPIDYEAIKAEAWQEGFQLGYDSGTKQAAEEQRDAGTRLSALIQGVTSDHESLIRGVETQVVQLALAIAEKVIAREARVDPTLVLDVVRAALSEVADASELRIRVNTADVPVLEGRWQEMLPRSVAQHSELIADDLVERGGAIVETRIGYADSQLKTRLSQVMNAFQAVLDGEPV